MSDIHSTLSTCVCPRSRLFPWGGQKKKKFVLFGKGLTCVRLFSRENVRGFVWLLFAFWKKKKTIKTKIKAECTRVFTSVFRGPFTPQHVCCLSRVDGQGSVDLPAELRRSLSTADPVCERGARDGGASIRPTFLRHVSTGGGGEETKQQRALAACMHTNL